MIKLSNGHVLEYVVASGALGFDGKGWPWERPLVWLGLIKPELFVVVLKALTLPPTKGNYRWWNPLTWLPFSPWSCMKLIPGGAVNKVGLTNNGFFWWWEKVMPKINFEKQRIIVSIYGTVDELVAMARPLNCLEIVAIEVNPSCPNTGHGMPTAKEVIESVKAVKEVSRHPVIAKVSVVQDYLAIAKGLKGIAEAIAINSVPWEYVFPNQRSPLWRLEKKVGGGGGGVSGKPAQDANWWAVRELARQGSIPVIAPSIMEYKDMDRVSTRGARAFSFGTIHLWTPWAPTNFVKRDAKRRGS